MGKREIREWMIAIAPTFGLRDVIRSNLLELGKTRAIDVNIVTDVKSVTKFNFSKFKKIFAKYKLQTLLMLRKIIFSLILNFSLN